MCAKIVLLDQGGSLTRNERLSSLLPKFDPLVQPLLLPLSIASYTDFRSRVVCVNTRLAELMVRVFYLAPTMPSVTALRAMFGRLTTGRLIAQRYGDNA